MRPYAEVNGKIFELDVNGRYMPRGNTLDSHNHTIETDHLMPNKTTMVHTVLK